MNSGAIAVGHRGGVPLPSPVLFLSLLLFQFKLTLLFCFALFTAKCFSHQLVFFSLHLQRLL